MYSVVWQYEIISANHERFEQEYGPQGSWHELFSRSDQYLGSFLHRSDTNPNRYLLIDTWTTRVAYEEFIEANREIYDDMSAKFEHLYTTEQRIGAFDRV